MLASISFHWGVDSCMLYTYSLVPVLYNKHNSDARDFEIPNQVIKWGGSHIKYCIWCDDTNKAVEELLVLTGLNCGPNNGNSSNEVTTLGYLSMWTSILISLVTLNLPIKVKGECGSYQAPPCLVFALISQTVALTGHTATQGRPTAISVVPRETFLKRKTNRINIKRVLPNLSLLLMYHNMRT